MGIFGGGKRKPDSGPVELPTDIDDIRRMVNNPTNVRMSQVRQPDESSQPVWKGENAWREPKTGSWEREPEQEAHPAYAPLFVKIDRYRNILTSLGSIKTAIGLVKSSFGALNELEKARDQTLGVIREALERVEKKLSSLDNELVRPTGFSTHAAPEDYRDTHAVEATVADLKGQVQQLRSELEQL